MPQTLYNRETRHILGSLLGEGLLRTAVRLKEMSETRANSSIPVIVKRTILPQLASTLQMAWIAHPRPTAVSHAVRTLDMPSSL